MACMFQSWQPWAACTAYRNLHFSATLPSLTDLSSAPPACATCETAGCLRWDAVFHVLKQLPGTLPPRWPLCMSTDVCCTTALMLRCTTLPQPAPCAFVQVPACRHVPHQRTCAKLHHSDSVFLLCIPAEATPISGSTTGISKILYTRGQCNLGVSALACRAEG